jgi:hypothetical protein
MIEITLTIDFGSAARQLLKKTVALSDGSTVLDALSISVPVVTCGKYGMDHFIEEIDGIKNEFAHDRGWHFEVNGYRSNVPAERYLVKNGDWIKWLYLAET